MNDRYFLIYTTEEGGMFKTVLTNGNVRTTTPEEYEEIKRTGEFTYNAEPWGERMVTEMPVFIALCRVEDNHDFVLGASREKAAMAA